jgi:CubicO group peptidase (beta-lactamase class C family)
MNWKIKYLILGIAFWLLIFLGWEWWSSYPKVRLIPPAHPESKVEKIDSILIRSLSEFLIPGIAMGIVEDEKVTYLKAFGFENLETKDSLTLQSQIPVASVSKVFTALSLANFSRENRIPIDTSFNAVLPFDKKLPDEFNEISIRDLLEHTSGLSDSRSFRNLIAREEKRQLSLLPNYLKSPDRGSREYQYADVNFDLIGYLLESRSNEAFDELITANTLVAGGMEKSYFATERPSGSFQGYKQTFLWKRIQTMELKFERYPSPSSGLILTPEDLSKALLHLCRGNMGTFDDELKWLQGNSGTPAGFQKITINNTEFMGHFGEQDGFSSLLLYSPSSEIGLFLLSNSEDKHDFRKLIPGEILKIITP